MPSYGPTDFEWSWEGTPLAPDFGFEVSVWREGESQSGVHDAVLDNTTGVIDPNAVFHLLKVSDIRYAHGVRHRSGIYLWTVDIVRIKPAYTRLGLQSPPVRFRYERKNK